MTYLTLFKDEVRDIELIIRNDDETKFIPTSASCVIMHDDLIVERCTVSLNVSGSVNDNVITAKITNLTTHVPTEYDVIWTFKKDDLIFKHKTFLCVLEN